MKIKRIVQKGKSKNGKMIKNRTIAQSHGYRWRADATGTERYTLNREFQFIKELRDLILKSSPAEKEEITVRLNKIGHIKLAIVAGAFLDRDNSQNAPTDLLVVSDDLDRRKFGSFLKYLEAETGGEVRFVVMEKDEFSYRLSMFDRFVRVLLEGPHEKLINKLGV